MKQKIETAIPQEEIVRQRQFTARLKEYVEGFRQINGRGMSAAIHTYGCQMNVHDSEKLKGMLMEAGFEIKEDDSADVVLFNTCCVRDHAETRVYGNVGHLGKIKRDRPELIIGVCGCMMQQQDVAEALYKRFPFVNMVFGTHALYRFPEILYHAIVAGKRSIDVKESEGLVPEHIPVARDKGASAFVTIMYGCNNFCTYCVVPYVRGRERSRQPQDIVDEVKKLAAEGYQEITLLGQNVNSYGKDLENAMSFGALLRKLDQTEGLKRLRFMTSHPKDLTEELISAMAESKNVCHHIHLPVQSGSDRILKMMNRHYTKEKYLDLVRRLRQRIPDIEISTDIIVGFPQETEEDFQDTLDLVEKVGYCAAFTFMYSPRKGTPAAVMEGQIDEEVKRERLSRLNELQARKCAENNEKYLGTIQEVLVEGCDTRDGCNAFGKTGTFKSIYFPGDESLLGKLVIVKVTETKNNSLLGILHKEN